MRDVVAFVVVKWMIHNEKYHYHRWRWWWWRPRWRLVNMTLKLLTHLASLFLRFNRNKPLLHHNGMHLITTTVGYSNGGGGGDGSGRIFSNTTQKYLISYLNWIRLLCWHCCIVLYLYIWWLYDDGANFT